MASEPRPPEDPDYLCSDCGARVADYVPEPDEEPFPPMCGVCAGTSHPMAGIRRPTRMLRDTDCDGPGCDADRPHPSTTDLDIARSVPTLPRLVVGTFPGPMTWDGYGDTDCNGSADG
jgi:hypothetical protein